MSTFQYNGISLTPCRTVAYRRDVRLDSGASYLWTEHVLTVEGIFNPALTSYNYVGSVNNPQPFPGKNPAYTDSIVRHTLSQPRGRLFYTVAGPQADGTPAQNRDGLTGNSLVVLDVPPGAADNPLSPAGRGTWDTDANNGPVVLGLTVVPVGGMIRTWFVRITVRACVNECFNYYSTPCVLLSHRWTTTHDIDRDYLTTRTVRGHAIFRSDALRAVAGDVQVDDYRQALGHPVPVGFKREFVHVTPHEDGNRIDYLFVDRETVLTVVAQNVSRIEAYGTVSEFGGSVGPVLISALMGWATGGRGAGGAIRGAARGALNSGNLPSAALSLVVRVWGTKAAARSDLVRTAETIAGLKFPPLFKGNGTVVSLDVVFDLMGRYAEYRATIQAPGVIGGLAALIAGAGGQGIADRLGVTQILDDEIPGYVTATPQGPGPQPSGSGGTRGSYAAVAVSQALQQPCVKPPAPALPRTAVDRTIPDPQR